jgi:hypothetical protein
MANVNAAKYQVIGDPFSNELKTVELVYDFSTDGGADADQYRLAQVQSAILVVGAVIQVSTAFTSGGSATVTVGAETADPDGFLASTAVATLVDNYAKAEAAGQALVIGAGDYISLNPGTADLTAGKLHVHLIYKNAR